MYAWHALSSAKEAGRIGQEGEAGELRRIGERGGAKRAAVGVRRPSRGVWEGKCRRDLGKRHPKAKLQDCSRLLCAHGGLHKARPSASAGAFETALVEQLVPVCEKQQDHGMYLVNTHPHFAMREGMLGHRRRNHIASSAPSKREKRRGRAPMAGQWGGLVCGVCGGLLVLLRGCKTKTSKLVMGPFFFVLEMCDMN